MTDTGQDGYARLLKGFRRQLQAAETRRVGGQRRRRRAAGSVLVLAVIAVGMVVLAGIGGGGRLDFVAQARAALAPEGQIVHLVTTSHMELRGGPQSEIVGREAGENTPRVAERWSTAKPLRWRVASVVPIVTAHGTVTGPVELSYDDGTEELFVKTLNVLNVRTGVSEDSPWTSRSSGPLGTDPVGRIHAMLEAGQLHDAGSGTVNGHAVRRLVGQGLGSPLGSVHSPWPVEYDVDPETYAPFRFTVEEVGMSFPGNTGTPTAVVDISTYEQLPLNDSSASLLRVHPTGSPRVERHQASTSEDTTALPARSHKK